MVGRRLRELRRDLREIRRTLTPTRDAVHKVLDGRIELDQTEATGELFPRDVEIAFGDAYDKLLRATEALESSRDSLAGVRDFLQGTIANDQNEVVKRLTVIASLCSCRRSSSASTARTSATCPSCTGALATGGPGA